MIADLVPAYLARRREEVAHLRSALEAGNLELVRISGHRLAGSASGYGFPQIGRVGRELEQAALRRDATAASGAVDQLARMLDEVPTTQATAMALRVAVLEDDPEQLALVRRWLEAAGHRCVGFSRSGDLMKAVGSDTFDAFVLDWMVPDMSGEVVLRWIRRALPTRVPVMFATACDDESEIVEILGLGADDYLVKPLRPAEFVARVEALGRRSRPAPSSLQAVGPYRYDATTHCVLLEGRVVPMPPRLAEVARVLLERPGELVSRGHLYERGWGRPLEGNTRTVDTHVSRLRRLLGLDGRHGWRLVSVYQHGYRLEPVAGDNTHKP